ncbi:hypothetical protein [Arthrobacter sp. ERGS1:01]|uniref:hypothetical protein n=1 Tax=Arthrobacter sp. ERGS1:01 TaxID=1704044 RepID=UPI001364DDD2|nr:hypothetical protein [Arthrobacter sp. ERGS1:01]
MAALCMAFIIGAIVIDRDSGACPPSNWHNHIALTLAGNQARVDEAAAITACTGARCIPPAPTFAKNASAGNGLLSRQEDGSWLFTVGSVPPSSVTFRTFDVAGNMLSQQSNVLNWTRVGGTEQCGGPMGTMRVVVRVP